MQCIILSGGLATRMRPLTQSIPKSLIPINNRPFIDYQLEYLSCQGITDVLLCIGHLGYMIKDYLGNSKYNLSIDYSNEGENLLGTAGAIRLAFDQNKLQNNFFIMYGDSFLPINFKSVYDSFI